MMFIELFAPKGTLSDRQRRQITERLINDVMSAPDAPESVIEAGKALCQAVVHEPETWVVGGRQVELGEPPRYLVRASVPVGWIDEMSAHLIASFTRILADVDTDPDRLYEEPHAWVHVVGVPEGGYGTMGKAMTSNDVVRLVTKAYREGVDGERPAPPPGSVIDPICGMSVALNERAITLEHEGATHAFCSNGCRAVFAEDRGIPIPR